MSRFFSIYMQATLFIIKRTLWGPRVRVFISESPQWESISVKHLSFIFTRELAAARIIGLSRYSGVSVRRELTVFYYYWDEEYRSLYQKSNQFVVLILLIIPAKTWQSAAILFTTATRENAIIWGYNFPSNRHACMLKESTTSFHLTNLFLFFTLPYSHQ